MAEKDTATTEDAGPARVRPSIMVFHRQGVTAVSLPREGELVIGRDASCNVTIADPGLSRRHASLRLVPDRMLLVTDLESRNGVLFRGDVVTEARLSSGEEVSLGGVVVAFHDTTPTPLVSFERWQTQVHAEMVRARRASSTLAIALVTRRTPKRPAREWCSRIAVEADSVTSLYSEGIVCLARPGCTEIDVRQQLVAMDSEVNDLIFGAGVFPTDGSSLEELLEKASERLAREKLASDAPVESTRALVCTSPAMREVQALIRRVATSQLTVLVLGETGTGKELLARSVHDASPRRDKPLVTVSCAAIPSTLLESVLFGHERGAFTGADKTKKGIFEQAQDGTVFLDEVGELTPSAQAALLRVLETRKVVRVGGDREIDVNVRVVSATHRPLSQMVTSGHFREDLFFRLDGVTVKLPPLRERPEELDALIQVFISEANAANDRNVRGVSPPAMQLLRGYRFPGNVRELKNLIERAVVISDGEWITPDVLPDRVRAEAPAATPLATVVPPAPETAENLSVRVEFRERVKSHTQAYERTLLESTLQACDWNYAEVSQRLGIPQRTLFQKIKELGLKKP